MTITTTRRPKVTRSMLPKVPRRMLQCNNKWGMILALAIIYLVNSLLFGDWWLSMTFSMSSASSPNDLQEKFGGGAATELVRKMLRDPHYETNHEIMQKKQDNSTVVPALHLLQRPPREVLKDYLLQQNQDNSTVDPPTVVPAVRRLLPPQEVFKDYREWHSHESLLRQPENRSFIIGYYSCPLQAGNRLHDFFHALITAIAVNRTLLWKYYDKETCSHRGGSFNKDLCDSTNTEADCSGLVKRASWLPSYDEWAPTFNLTNISPRPLPKRSKEDIETKNNRLEEPVPVVFAMRQNPRQAKAGAEAFIYRQIASNQEIVKKLYSESGYFYMECCSGELLNFCQSG
jgi:hypothetical protein